jgi:hypothetical protein
MIGFFIMSAATVGQLAAVEVRRLHVPEARQG